MNLYFKDLLAEIILNAIDPVMSTIIVATAH
jgi:hypothetical protein